MKNAQQLKNAQQFSNCIWLKFYSDLHLTEILLEPARSLIFSLITSARTEFIACHKIYMISAYWLAAIHYRYTGPIRMRGPLGLLAHTDSHILLAVAGDEWRQSRNGPEITLY